MRVALLFYVLFVCAAVGGWIANIVKLAGMDFGHVGGMLVIRAIGIVAAPLGAVMGYV